ncbi:hypothetical protein D9C73_022292 [Collichthys lucidus]|uniref:Uncharacterized protein n=1 Tax=Collichthys lucidus TaxID=240159 RepID=A0A4U5VLE4_COLLU|nr:hypothetical protein D9C73_022292 [Collichthys lucidus]
MRALVKQRLTAAAQEIFALFEGAVSEYEEQLCRLKEENQRQRELLDAVLKPELRLQRAGLCCTSTTHCTVTERPYVCSIYSARVMGQEVELLHRWSCCTGGAAAQVELGSKYGQHLTDSQEEVPPSSDQEDPAEPPHIKRSRRRRGAARRRRHHFLSL